MSTWKPSDGLVRAEMLVQILEVEARAAGSVITPVFRHRLVEMIGKTLDGGVVSTLTVTPAQVQEWAAPWVTEEAPIPDSTVPVNGTYTNGPLQSGRIVPIDPEDAVTHGISKPEKAAKGKPAKKGKRGRPSKAELAARAAQG